MRTRTVVSSQLVTSLHCYTHYITIGTYFGPKSEYDALGFQDKLAHNATVDVVEVDDWLGSVSHWAEDEVLKLIGGIVSRRLPP